MYDEPIDMINDIIEVVENSYLTVERTEKLTNFLSSLVVDVPTSVAKWFESLTEKEKKIDSIEKLNVRMYLPQNVYDWLNGQKDNFYTIVKNMILFGYNEVSEVIIKSPSSWDTQETYYVYKEYDDGDCYFISGYIGDATRFTVEEAKKVMQLLRVDWDLEEVQIMKADYSIGRFYVVKPFCRDEYLLHDYVYTDNDGQYRLTENKDEATKFMYLEAVNVKEQMTEQMGPRFYIERA